MLRFLDYAIAGCQIAGFEFLDLDRFDFNGTSGAGGDLAWATMIVNLGPAHRTRRVRTLLSKS